MKQLSNTKVTVRLRKAEGRKEWYVYLESYPVYVPGKQTPQRIREYLNRCKAALKQAFVDGYLTTDLSAKIKGIQEQESRREYLTVEELNTLVATPCERDVLKRAALFSARTGLRHCDIQ